MKHCGNPKCSTSTGICESITHGSGHLDRLGYWQFPCFVCARHYEKTKDVEWPFTGQTIEPMPTKKCKCGHDFVSENGETECEVCEEDHLARLFGEYL